MLSGVLSAITVYIYRQTKSIKALVLVALFYALTPLWWSSALTIVKDSLYLVFFSWFFLVFVKICQGEKGKGLPVQLVLSGLLVSLMRYGTLLLVFVTFLAILLLQKDKKKYLFLLAVLMLGYFSFYKGISIGTGLKYSEPQEALSIPFQQLARLAYYKKGEIEKEDLKQIYELVSEKKVAKYNPEISDPVRRSLKGFRMRQWLSAGRLYAKYFLKYPALYLEAFVYGTFGYYYPFYFSSTKPLYLLYISGDKPKNVELDKFIFSNKARSSYYLALTLQRKIPFLSFLVNPGFYTWLLVFIAFALCKAKKFKSTYIFVPPLLLFLTCVISPVNGHLRYFMPIMAITPLLLSTSVSEICLPIKRK